MDDPNFSQQGCAYRLVTRRPPRTSQLAPPTSHLPLRTLRIARPTIQCADSFAAGFLSSAGRRCARNRAVVKREAGTPPRRSGRAGIYPRQKRGCAAPSNALVLSRQALLRPPSWSRGPGSSPSFASPRTYTRCRRWAQSTLARRPSPSDHRVAGQRRGCPTDHKAKWESIPAAIVGAKVPPMR
jgi:hypothetical protein